MKDIHCWISKIVNSWKELKFVAMGKLLNRTECSHWYIIDDSLSHIVKYQKGDYFTTVKSDPPFCKKKLYGTRKKIKKRKMCKRKWELSI